MHKEEVIEMLKKAFGCNMEDNSIVYHSVAYDWPIYFTPRDRELNVGVGGFEFDIPYNELERIEDYPDRFYIRMKYYNRVRTYVVWR